MKTTWDAVNELRGDLSNLYSNDGKGDFIKIFLEDGDYVRSSCAHRAGSTTHKYICTVDEFNSLAAEMENNFGKCTQSYAEYKDSYIKPEETPKQYTKEMYEADKLPKVGMECLVLNTCDAHPKYTQATIKYVGDLVVYLCVEKGECCGYACGFKFKPIDPKVELIDGKAYQFDYHDEKSVHGLYEDDGRQFYVVGCSYDVDNCTNIKQLTVKESK